MNTENAAKKTFLVTGATGEIGFAIARQIASNPRHRVILVNRNAEKSAKAVAEIQRETGNQQVYDWIFDVSRKQEVFDFAESFDEKVDVIVNNAATAPRNRKETPEGIELQFATNVLGYFWMSQAFLPHLKKSDDPRIVNVASYWAGDLDLDDLEFERRRYSNGTAYRQSKQANRMLTVAFADRYDDYGIKVNACHPGDVNSTLSNDLGFGGSESAVQGAETPVLLATTSLGREHTGKYFANGRLAKDYFAQQKNDIENIYRKCNAY